MAEDAPRTVTVEIMGKRYPIRSTLDIEYITELAQYVEQKIQSAQEHSTGGDVVRITVLAALNIADEYFHVREQKQVKRRAGEIEEMVDRAIDRFS